MAARIAATANWASDVEPDMTVLEWSLIYVSPFIIIGPLRCIIYMRIVFLIEFHVLEALGWQNPNRGEIITWCAWWLKCGPCSPLYRYDNQVDLVYRILTVSGALPWHHITHHMLPTHDYLPPSSFIFSPCVLCSAMLVYFTFTLTVCIVKLSILLISYWAQGYLLLIKCLV